ncbi:MAG: tetratricopeptide repeat protein, partial [Gammaproteobacteria bacterium]|nr:tetratricopeptide repeat protein [Gammaproteobacteria bacterium]
MDRYAQTFQHALASFQQGQLPQAEALCADILRNDPRHCDALHLAGLVAMQVGEIPRSIELIRQSLDLRPHQAVAHLNLANALLRAGKPQAALVSCDAALAQRPDYAEALNCRGNALLQLQRPAEAVASYDQALRSRPELAPLHNNRGHALRDLQRSEDALASYRRALQLQPGLRESLLGAGEMYLALGQPHEASRCCEAALAQHAGDPDALHLRARLHLRLREPAAALADVDRALAVRPDASALLMTRGNVLCQLRRLEEALQVYRDARRLAPADVEPPLNEGHALTLLHRYEEALACYEQAATLKPDCAKAYHWQSVTLRLLRRPIEALAASELALASDPHHVAALNAKGHALYELDRYTEALAAHEQALRLDARSAEALSGCARVMLPSGRPETAAGYLERLLEVEPELPAAEFSMLLHARLLSCDWRDYTQLTAGLEQGIESGKRIAPPSLYTASGLAPEDALRCAREHVRANLGTVSPAPWSGAPYGHERIRVAYLSGDFREHPVSFLMASIFEGHDRSRFEPIGLATRPPDDSALARRVVASFERFFDVTRQQDTEVVALLRRLEVDICVDLSGYTAYARHGVFARRAAPVQVNYLGYPGTLGAPFMDYIIADALLIPEPEQAFYSEKPVYLPHCYLPPGDRRAVAAGAQRRSDHGLPEQGFVFCAFNNHAKIVPPMFEVWMRLLHAVEGSVLWLTQGSEAVTRNLTAEAVRRGIQAERLVFAPRVPKVEDHLARHQLADLFLDTLPYNAHTTASDALWCGLPVLTCLGRNFPGRVAASLLEALALPELIATSLEDYESRAVEMARDTALL